MMNIAFAGFRHSHIWGLYDMAVEHPEICVVGSFEEDEETREAIAQKRGITFNYATYEELLADPCVQAVAIGDYYGIRAERVIQALKSGKHVIADKPLCTSSQEADAIRQLTQETDLKVFLMLDMRYNDVFYTVKNLLEQDAIGEIKNIFFQGQHPLMYGSRPQWYFEEGKHGGTINDIAVHGIDIIKYMTGLEIKKVNGARTWNAYAQDAKDFQDCGIFMCELTGGAGLLADVSYSAPDTMGYSMPTYWHFQIWGMKGMMQFGYNLDTIELYLSGEKEVQKIKPSKNPKKLLDDFLDSIEQRENVVLTTQDVLYCTEATLRIQEKAMMGIK